MMVDILHRVGVEAPAGRVHAALTHPERLADWWTTDTRGTGDVLEFRFTSGGFAMRIVDLTPDQRVHRPDEHRRPESPRREDRPLGVAGVVPAEEGRAH